MKYSKLEIMIIFQNCQNWDDLAMACECFVYLIENDIEYYKDMELRLFMKHMAIQQFKKIEEL